MNFDEIVAASVRVGFERPDILRKLALPAVELTPGKSGTGSQLGGLPSLPADVPWPEKNGQSLAFIAEVDLTSLSKTVQDDALPQEGKLLFFYDVEQSTWGFDPKDEGSFAVLYVPDSVAPKRVTDYPADIPEEARYKACSLDAKAVLLLPPWENVVIENLELDPLQADAYANLLSAVNGEDWPNRSLLGGHPDQIQGDMTLECAMVTEGLYCGDATGYSDSRMPLFRERALQWRLLLQVHSAEDEAGMMWGDAGCLYYWIREEDLRARRFDRSWMILQCG